MNILDLIYPNKCAICDGICKNSLCEECELILQQKISFNKITYTNKEFKTLNYFSKYEGILRDKLLAYKFNNKSYLYKFFAEIITKFEKEYSFFENYDIITPVPIHKKRKIQRGYNQTELIARHIAKKYKMLNYINILVKTKNTAPQSILTKKEREENIKNVYKMNSVDIVDKKIILFDDIYTTGSTANECSRVLMENGAKQIAVLTIAKD